MHIPTGDELRRARERRGLTQANLAARADVSQPLIARIENGDVDPTLSTLHAIISALNDSSPAFDADTIELTVQTALKDARKQAGYTQGELADAAGVSQPLISRIEREGVDPRASTLRSLFEHLNPVEEPTPDEAKSTAATDESVLAVIESELEELRNGATTSPAGDETDRTDTQSESTDCPSCNTDLSDYPEPSYCPNCGVSLNP